MEAEQYFTFQSALLPIIWFQYNQMVLANSALSYFSFEYTPGSILVTGMLRDSDRFFGDHVSVSGVVRS